MKNALFIPIAAVLIAISCRQAVQKQVEQTTATEQSTQIENTCEGNFTDETLNTVLQQLNLKRNECYIDLVTGQTTFFNQNRTVWVIPKKNSTEEDEQNDEVFSLNCTIILADTKTGKIISQYKEPLRFESDAYKLTGFTVKSYHISDQLFSLMANYQVISPSISASSSEAILFSVQGASLRKVYEYTAMKQCEEATENYKKNIIFMEEQQSNGLYNIAVRKTMEELDEPDFLFLQYDGEKYKEMIPNDTATVYFSYSGVDVETGIGWFQEWFCFGKTPEQAYQILREKYKPYLKSEIPCEEISYTMQSEENDTDNSAIDSLTIHYAPLGSDGPNINIESNTGSTVVKIIPQKGYIHITAVSID